MKTQIIHSIVLGICLATIGCAEVQAATRHSAEEVRTDAGQIDISIVNQIKHGGVYHQIKNINTDEKMIDLENGSRWSVANADMVKGWGKSKNLVITQNHSGFSTSRYALLNLDLKQAEPISLVREPTPQKDVFFVKSVDLVNDIVSLNEGKSWIVHASDRGKLSKLSENDRIVIGVNTGADKERSPYLLIDTANNHFVRAHIIE